MKTYKNQALKLRKTELRILNDGELTAVAGGQRNTTVTLYCSEDPGDGPSWVGTSWCPHLSENCWSQIGACNEPSVSGCGSA
jgi:hypothetical protein